MYNAIYTRQSVEKADSISIESQIEYCKHETRGDNYKEYNDRGYSGKNTNRPAFEEMLSDIQRGKVSKVIVYKLDRISRSILDFANMMEAFQRHKVEFVSSTEKFDTSTPIGRAMLNICVTFAQLERETIQKRITDAYYSRNKRGFFMGGRVSYGFTTAEAIIDGVKTSRYLPVPEEIEQVQIMFKLYADPANSLGDIVKYFNKHGITYSRGGIWSTSQISAILRNPVYVQADANVYEFFKSQGAIVVNPVEEFTGQNACYLYKGSAPSKRLQNVLAEKEVVLAPHAGVVSSEDWLKCRLRCLTNRQLAKPGKVRNSWLVGKAKCGKCGFGLTARVRNSKRVFTCNKREASRKAGCAGIGKAFRVDVLEDYMLNAIRQKLAEFAALEAQAEKRINPKLNANKIRMAQIDAELDELLSKVIGANAVLMKYINAKAETLDAERKGLQEEILSLTYEQDGNSLEVITNHVKQWDSISFEDRQVVVNALVKVIHVADGEIEVTWKL